MGELMVVSKGRTIRAGIGGWVYPPWRGVFYPKGLKQADELAFATQHLTTIEINATHYRLQSPASFRKWADTAPQSFVFSVKGPRLVTQQKVLAETGKFIERFIGSGLSELGDKLGPILWQFAPFKQFDEEDFAKFLALLPKELDGLKLNHVVEARHKSFETAALHRAASRVGRGARLYRRRDLAEHCRSQRRCGLCAATAGRRQTRCRLSAEGARCLGSHAPKFGRKAKRHQTCLFSHPPRQRRDRATSSSISSTKES